jgi:hypothetical protein
MPTRTTSPEADDSLDLPPLDGEGDDVEGAAEDLDEGEDERNYLDDATGEDAPHDDIGGEHPESGWLLDAEPAGGLDIGAADFALFDEGLVLDDDEPETLVADDDISDAGEAPIVDGGEEGPLADDEELREEDLPLLDADDEGEGGDEAFFDRAALPELDELRWDDRAWARVAEAGDATEDQDDSGVLAVPSEDVGPAGRDAVFRTFEESGRLTAAVVLPGESVVVAIDTAGGERALLVRIQPDGSAHIIAEVELASGGDGAPCRVRSLRWDAARGWLLAFGPFGVQAFRPA